VEFGRQGFIKGSRPPAMAWRWRACLNYPPAYKPYGQEAERLYSHYHELKVLIRL